MKEIVFLFGVLAVLMVALGLTRQQIPESPRCEVKQQIRADDEWVVINCEQLERYGDTIIAIQTLVKRKQNGIE